MEEQQDQDTHIDIVNDKPAATLNVGGDTCKQALKAQVAAGKLTQPQADLIWWFFSFSKEKGLSLRQAGHEINMDTTTMSRLFSGTYGAKVDNICGRIARVKRLSEERRDKMTFISTSISHRVFQVCEAALVSQSIAFIWGRSQVGKTTALIEYQRANNHGQTKYVRLPASAGVQLVAKEIARACYVSQNSCFEGIRHRILESIDDKNLVIIDEAHQAFLSYQKGSAIKVMEFLREIYDRTGCGMVLCGTRVLRDEVISGKLALMMEQINLRGIIKVQLPDRPPMKDIEKIARAFGLNAPEGSAAEAAKECAYAGMGKYVKFLQAAQRMAAKENSTLNWEHFIRTRDILARLSKEAEL